jgi:hypothetical protein
MAAPWVKIDPALADLLAGKDTTSMIVSLLRTMPLADQAALASMLAAPAVRVRTDLEQTIAAQPVEALRELAQRRALRVRKPRR